MTMTKKILIIDDEKDFVEVLSARLRYSGFDVINAFDGIEGLKKAKAEVPDLILLDIMLPKLDGREALMEFKLDEVTRSIPIIAITAIVEKFNKDFTLELGARGYLQKPFDYEVLLQMIKNLLG